MRLGVFTFFNASGIGPVDLAVGLETRGFGSLFVAEHSHIPVDAKVLSWEGMLFLFARWPWSGAP